MEKGAATKKYFFLNELHRENDVKMCCFKEIMKNVLQQGNIKKLCQSKEIMKIVLLALQGNN